VLIAPVVVCDKIEGSSGLGQTGEAERLAAMEMNQVLEHFENASSLVPHTLVA
jgi:hypothetical protein